MQFATLDVLQVSLEIAQQGCYVLLLRDGLAGLMRIEITVWALAYAPGNVNVQAEWGKLELPHEYSRRSAVSSCCMARPL